MDVCSVGRPLIRLFVSHRQQSKLTLVLLPPPAGIVGLLCAPDSLSDFLPESGYVPHHVQRGLNSAIGRRVNPLKRKVGAVTEAVAEVQGS
jgi:hypothetical protein